MKPELLKRGVSGALIGVILFTLSIALGTAFVKLTTRPQVVVVEQDDESWIQNTFRTTNLVVDSKIQFGPTVVPTSLAAFFSVAATNQTTQIWSQNDSAGHLGFAGNNENINLTIRNTTTFDTTISHVGHATGIDLVVSGGHSAGVDALEVQAIASNAVCADSPCQAYSFKSLLGTMQNDGVVTFQASPSVSLGNAVQRATVMPTTPLVTVPQFDIGIIAPVDGANMHIKNTATGVNGAGIEIEGDTTVSANVAPQLVLYRGAGGGAGGLFGLICVDNGVGSCMSGAAANDFVVANYFAGKTTYISQATGSIILGTTAAPTLTLDSSHNAQLVGTLAAGGYNCANTTSPAAFAAGANGTVAIATTTNCIYRVTADAANSTIAGISTHANGTYGTLCNVAAAGTLTLLNDVAGTPTDGFKLKAGLDRILVSNECVQIEYVPTTTRWMLIN